MKRERKNKIISEIKSFAILFIIVFAFRSTFFEPFKIPSGSMIPTLMIGDFILVKKFSYGFKLPFSEWFSDPIYIGKPEDPKRGDVIVFKFPKDKSLNYIKRVVGLPGETIEIRDKVVYINGVAIEQTEIAGKDYMKDMDDKFMGRNLMFFEAQTGEHKHVIQFDKESFFELQKPATIIPAGHFFVMGDNRDYSSDSRVWGFVPHENIKGKAILVWFSMIFPFGEDSFKFRPWRIGKVIN